MSSSTKTLHIDCSVAGIAMEEGKKIFQGSTINIHWFMLPPPGYTSAWAAPSSFSIQSESFLKCIHLNSRQLESLFDKIISSPTQPDHVYNIQTLMPGFPGRNDFWSLLWEAPTIFYSLQPFSVQCNTWQGGSLNPVLHSVHCHASNFIEHCQSNQF